MALGDLDASTPLAVRSANGDHYQGAYDYNRLGDPRIHGKTPFSFRLADAESSRCLSG